MLHNNFEREPHAPKFVVWEDLIKTSGIGQKHSETLLEQLRTCTYPYHFIARFAAYLEKEYPHIFEYDDAQKRYEDYGIKNEIVLTDEQKTLYNLFHQLRSDQYDT